MGNLESSVNLQVFWLWEEVGVPRGTPHRHGKNMQTPHRKVPPQLGIEPRTLSVWGNSANHQAIQTHGFAHISCMFSDVHFLCTQKAMNQIKCKDKEFGLIVSFA